MTSFSIFEGLTFCRSSNLWYQINNECTLKADPDQFVAFEHHDGFQNCRQAELGSTAKLADGNLIPRLGLGVYEMSDQEASRAVTWALEAGYRHFDW